jgi:ATP synthase protein I
VSAEKKDDKLSLYGQLSLLVAIPFLLAAGPLIGFFIGKYLDEWLGTGPYLMYVFIIMGFVAAGKEVYSLVKKVSERV